MVLIMYKRYQVDIFRFRSFFDLVLMKSKRMRNNTELTEVFYFKNSICFYMDTTEYVQVPLQKPESNIKLKKIKFENYKSFKSITIELSDLSVLVGPNNSGKTNILIGIYGYFEFLKQLNAQRKKLKEGATKANCDVLFFKVPKVEQIWYNKKWISRKHVPVIFEFEFSDGLIMVLNLNLYYGVPHIKLLKTNKELTNDYITKLLDTAPVILPGFIGLLIEEEYSTHAIREQFIAAGRNSEILRNTIYDLQEYSPERYILLKNILEKYFSAKLKDIIFKEAIDPYITSEFIEDGTSLDLICAGGGFLQILQLLTYILTKRTAIILLDEPDAHLYPQLQKTLISILYEIQKKLDLQIILSTHSKEIINNINPNYIIPIFKDATQGKGLTSYFESLKVINDLGPIDNIDLALAIKTRKILFIEGPSDKIIKQIADVIESDVFIKNPYVIIPRGGVENIRYYEDAKIISDFIHSKIKVFSMIDGDYRCDEEKQIYIEKSKKHNVEVFILGKKELDNYLLIPELIMTAINEKRKNRNLPSIEEKIIIDMLNKICDSMKENVQDQYLSSIQKFYRQLDKPNDPVTLSPIARKIVNNKWHNLDEKLSICPGSQIITEINKIISKDLISINSEFLINYIKKEQVHKDIKDIIKKLS